MSISETVEDLGDGLNLGIIEGILARVGVHTEAIYARLMPCVESRGRIGGIRDEGVDGVGHLVAENRELVHLHFRLVLTVHGFVTNQAGGRDHVGGHTVADKEDDILCLALLSKVSY